MGNDSGGFAGADGDWVGPVEPVGGRVDQRLEAGRGIAAAESRSWSASRGAAERGDACASARRGLSMQAAMSQSQMTSTNADLPSASSFISFPPVSPVSRPRRWRCWMSSARHLPARAGSYRLRVEEHPTLWERKTIITSCRNGALRRSWPISSGNSALMKAGWFLSASVPSSYLCRPLIRRPRHAIAG